MKGYLQEANLRMILVAPSIPEWRGKYLNELGIRCVELPEVPVDPVSASRVTDISRKNMRHEAKELMRDSAIRPEDRLEWEEATAQVTPRTCAIARRFLRDSLEPVRTHFSEYEIVPYCITRGHCPDVGLEYDEVTGYGKPSYQQGGVWWAYRFGRSQKAPPNDIPNISVMTSSCGINVTVNAELQPSQEFLKQRIRSSPGRFNRILRELGGLTLLLYLKYEHQPFFYHWILCLRKLPGEFDAETVLGAYNDHGKRFEEEKDYWIGRIIRENRNLTDGQRGHLERSNRPLNLATRISSQFLEGDPLWRLPYDGQAKRLTDSVIRLKPLLDFFVEDERK
jgi:hypothetical protein